MRGDCLGKWEESPLLVEETIWVEVRNYIEYMQNYACDGVAGVQGQKWEAMRLSTPERATSDGGPPVLDPRAWSSSRA